MHGLYFVLISPHGLMRSKNMELGRDPDTGGQIKYVVELAKALSDDARVDKVAIFTRQVVDSKVSEDYAKAVETVSENFRIIRLPFGPDKYLRKELLWPYLDTMADRALQFLRGSGRIPDIIHSHYADAGYVGARLAGLLGVPQVHTGHSLGRVKRQRLMAQGTREAVVEKQYNMNRRVEAEEYTLDNAMLVIASTHQEVEQQYSLYDHYDPSRMRVIPPGVDFNRFHPPDKNWQVGNIQNVIQRFLRFPDKPMLLALSRPDVRKNIATLVHAYGKHRQLRDASNLVIIAGNRKDIQAMDKGPREVLTELLLLIDFYNLYGHVAFPKYHEPDDVPTIYRVAVLSHGVFVNPAYTEPFGLTLLEAAACGLPIVATEDGGPRDIIENCHNGLLIDPYDADALGERLFEAITDRERWQQWQANGLTGVKTHYSWASHAQHYLEQVDTILNSVPQHLASSPRRAKKRSLLTVERLFACDIDDVLVGDEEHLQVFLNRLEDARGKVGFCIATGRTLKSALEELENWNIPLPDVLISSVGSSIYYGPEMTEDISWAQHINHRWRQDQVKYELAKLPGLTLQPKAHQGKRKISYFVDSKKAPPIKEIADKLRKRNLEVNLIYSHNMYLDVLPIRASKGAALRFFAVKWGMPVEKILVCGCSGNDEEMLLGDTLGVVVGNHNGELELLREAPRVYFSQGNYSLGVLQGIDHYHAF